MQQVYSRQCRTIGSFSAIADFLVFDFLSFYFYLLLCLCRFNESLLQRGVSLGYDGRTESCEAYQRPAAQVSASNPAVCRPRARILRIHGSRVRSPGTRDLVAEGQGGLGAGARTPRCLVQPGDWRVFAGDQWCRAGRRRCLFMPCYQRRRSGHMYRQCRRCP